MNTAGVGKIVRVTSAVLTGVIALSGYAGVIGLLGGGISLGDTIDARLPFGSLFLAGLALLAIVAVPMTVASVAAGRGMRYGADIVFGAGLVLVAWIAVELAFIKAYSWFSSLALGELVKPAFGSPITIVGLLPPTLLTALFLALAVLHLKKLSFRPSADPPTEPGRSSQSSVNNPPAEMATGSDRRQPSQPGSAG